MNSIKRMGISVGIVLLTTIIIFLSITKVKSSTIENNMSLGIKYYNEGHYEEAILAFNKVIRVDKRNIDARIELGKIYISNNQKDKAEEILKEIEEIISSSSNKDNYEEGEKKKDELQEKLNKETSESNTIGNISNGATVLKNNGYIYYQSPKDSYLYRTDIGLNERRQLNSEETSYINIVGDTILYLSGNEAICSINTNGMNRQVLVGQQDIKDIYATDLQKVLDEYKQAGDSTGTTSIEEYLNGRIYVNSLNVVDGYMYYIVSFFGPWDYGISFVTKTSLENLNEREIYRDRDDSTVQCIVSEDKIYSMQLVDHYAVPITVMYTNGKIINNCNDLIVVGLCGDDENIYAIHHTPYESPLVNGIYKADKNDLTKTELISENFNVQDFNNATMNFNDDTIFYTEGNKLYSLSLESKESQLIYTADAYITNMQVVDDYLYFTVVEELWIKSSPSNILIRMKFDSSELEVVE